LKQGEINNGFTDYWEKCFSWSPIYLLFKTIKIWILQQKKKKRRVYRRVSFWKVLAFRTLDSGPKLNLWMHLLAKRFCFVFCFWKDRVFLTEGVKIYLMSSISSLYTPNYCTSSHLYSIDQVASWNYLKECKNK
jgi:hypothetical protein